MTKGPRISSHSVCRVHREWSLKEEIFCEQQGEEENALLRSEVRTDEVRLQNDVSLTQLQNLLTELALLYKPL